MLTVDAKATTDVTLSAHRGGQVGLTTRHSKAGIMLLCMIEVHAVSGKKRGRGGGGGMAAGAGSYGGAEKMGALWALVANLLSGPPEEADA